MIQIINKHLPGFVMKNMTKGRNEKTSGTNLGENNDTGKLAINCYVGTNIIYSSIKIHAGR